MGHQMGIPLAWIITSRQVVDDLVNYLKALNMKVLKIMLNLKPCCFIVDDAPQKFKALQWIPILFNLFICFHVS
jgi:hypothetical protein